MSLKNQIMRLPYAIISVELCQNIPLKIHKNPFHATYINMGIKIQVFFSLRSEICLILGKNENKHMISTEFEVPK